ncbi:MAG: hypothetical protein MUE42_09525 [Opitutaceae bacterium]|jgi:capsid protein|nr:hypothetical protein [Opitutaceae bacterium]
MNPPPPPSASADPAQDDDTFLRALVKSSRQRTIHVRWTDRDGTARVTALTSAEATRLQRLARERGLPHTEALLRAAAHLPVAK